LATDRAGSVASPGSKFLSMARPNSRAGNLPAEATSFVGRRRELAEVRQKLSEGRLVTLVGPGGVGKTRLAIRVAVDLVRGFRDGGWLVGLADVGDPALVDHAVVAALDLRDQAAVDPVALLASYLHEKQLLLVVDNCEHLLEGAARMVAHVIRAAPGVRVIATSREPLSLPAEHVVAVPPLELPAPGAGEPLAELRRNEAVLLFTERARAAAGRFELTLSNEAAVVELCRRLDGLPLAIELAAVRMRVLGPEQIRDRLADRFALLTGGSRAALPRHQTLRTAIEWSHDLLLADERSVLRRLCVFAGRFTVEDVELVCAGADLPRDRAFDLLASLVEKSLVVKEDAKGVACYRLHETMREFAILKLREAGEEDVLERRCAEHYRSTWGRAAPEARFRLIAWLEWTELEIDNIRAVLQRCRTRGDGRLGLELACSLAWYWITRATSEGVRWLEELLVLAGQAVAHDARAHFLRGYFAVLQSDPKSALPALERAAAAARQAGEPRLLAEALSMASIAANTAGDHASAIRLLADAQSVSAGLGDHLATVAVLQARSLNALFEGDLTTVRSAASEGARRGREAGDLYTLQVMLLNLGSTAVIAGNLKEARTLLEEGLRIASQIDDRVAQFYFLIAFGCHAAAAKQPRPAAQLLGAADTVRISAGATVIPFLGLIVAQAEEYATTALGKTRFRAEFDDGRQLARQVAVDLALGRTSREPTTHTAGTARQLLGKRQADVAQLVAEGLSNKQIGGRLFISERTVDSHVRSILNKLGFNSRAQIAAWMASLHP
jgi:predicted ATPase/DNA-binding CsgD family transcriptional regulator